MISRAVGAVIRERQEQSQMDTIISFDTTETLVSQDGATVFGVKFNVTLDGGKKTSIMLAPQAVPGLISLAQQLGKRPAFAPLKGAA